MFTHEFELEISENLFPTCAERRERLVQAVKKEFPNKKGMILLLGNVETGHETFMQDSTFWYFSAIKEPGCAITIDLQTGMSTLFVPHMNEEKNNWNTEHISKNADAKQYGFHEIRVLGSEVSELCLSLRASKNEFQELISYLQEIIEQNGVVFTHIPGKNTSYTIDQFLELVKKHVPLLPQQLIDISKNIAVLRMKKDEQEVARLYQAIDVTVTAHEAALSTIRRDIAESEVQAAAEFVLTANMCARSFPTIVAGGKNATILHYHENKHMLTEGSLVVVDMGARYDYYCADLTRTYPVSGRFTKRQRELYSIVLDIQAQVAESARPGWFLSNKEYPEQSLQHLALSLFKTYKLDRYFIHGIGHHLGLDTHDLADRTKPLEVGNVITIEPGLYIKEENLGIRIEDNYLITEEGAVCLSENLPKLVEDIESMMRATARAEDLF